MPMGQSDFECTGVPDPNQVEEPVAIVGSGPGEGLAGSCSQRRGLVRDVDGDEFSGVFLFVLRLVQTAVDLLASVGDRLRIGEMSGHSLLP